MWKTYFNFVKLKPGRVVTAQFGEIDFSADNIGIEIIQALYENGFPYLEITEQSKAELYIDVSNTGNIEINNYHTNRRKKSK